MSDIEFDNETAPTRAYMVSIAKCLVALLKHIVLREAGPSKKALTDTFQKERLIK